jgi:3-oxoacyl-[acyl-carrier-protein] synthase II
VTQEILITGIGLEIPGLPSDTATLEQLMAPFDPAAFDPAAQLGRKGLRYKDYATKLALCAAQAALKDAGLPTTAAEQLSPETFGVVVSSNLGNLDTVCRVVDTIRLEGADGTSPLDGPNLSSNVIASSIAIRFRCQALNLMICNGSTSGSDALFWGANAIRARRARRVLVVGVEPVNAVTTKLMATSTWLDQADVLRFCDGAGAILLESEEIAAERNVRAYARVGDYAYGQDVAHSLRGLPLDRDRFPRRWLTPNCSYRQTASEVQRAFDLWGERPPAHLDLSASLGESYGALGVLQCIAACWWLRDEPGTVLATSGGTWRDGAASVLLSRDDD